MVVYNFLVRSYGFIIRLASVNNKKAAQWVNGRNYWRTILAKKLTGVHGQRVWIHCASYGEFEQGRPLIEALKQKYPGCQIILSFFSPSGYEAFKHWEGAAVVCYLPLDTRRNARDFIDLVKPQAAIFIKYEFWVNFLFQLKNKQVPAYLVSAVFKPHHPFFKWYGSIFRRSLGTFSRLFIQDEASGHLLKSIGITNYEVSGDTRFDRVLQIKAAFAPIPFFDNYCNGKQVIMGGSTWPRDEEILIEAFQKINDPNLRLIMAPHQVDQKSIAELELLLQKKQQPYTLYSKREEGEPAPVLVVDAMGLLSKLYHYADVAYVGGGFNSGIHNCLEPAVYLKPVLFYGGEDYTKYNEAVELVNMGAAVNIASPEELFPAISLHLKDEALRRNIATKLQKYFEENANTTGKILSTLKIGAL